MPFTKAPVRFEVRRIGTVRRCARTSKSAKSVLHGALIRLRFFGHNIMTGGSW
jgi:hypothetical protein